MESTSSNSRLEIEGACQLKETFVIDAYCEAFCKSELPVFRTQIQNRLSSNNR